MKFSILKRREAAFDMGDADRIENKLRINLSPHADSILLHDLDVFQVEPERRSTPKCVLINRIFEYFRDQAESSIASTLESRRIRLAGQLSEFPDPQARETAIRLILRDDAEELKEKSRKRLEETGEPFLIRIFKDNLQYLLSDEGQAESQAYNDKIGPYFKALLEEYCQLPYVERERIYFRKKKEEIDLAIRYRKMLRIVTRKQHRSYVKPLELRTDPGRMYHYLVGLTSSGREGPWKIGCFRLCFITDCKRLDYSGFIPSDQEKEIRRAISERGVQYLSGEDPIQKILVEFTPNGEKSYRQILHLRPQYTSHDGLIYEFHCPVKQAEDYFFKFGHNARILEPVYLAEKFQRKYQNAAKKYDSL